MLQHFDGVHWMLSRISFQCIKTFMSTESTPIYIYIESVRCATRRRDAVNHESNKHSHVTRTGQRASINVFITRFVRNINFIFVLLSVCACIWWFQSWFILKVNIFWIWRTFPPDTNAAPMHADMLLSIKYSHINIHACI